MADANAFISRAFAQDYWGSHGYTFATYSEDEQDAAIVRATQYLSDAFSWKGYRRKPRNYAVAAENQGLEWPRTGVVDGDGYAVPHNVIPMQLKWATAEVAFYELQNPNAFQPVHDASNVVRMEKVGPLATTYDTARHTTWGARPELLAVQDLIGEFIKVGKGSVMAGKVVRG